jgi:hypothetical protein
VRAKRAAELAALNAARSAAGDAPLDALPAKSHVSYTRASARHVTEAAALKRLTELAEKAYGPGGSGVLFGETDGVAVADAAAAVGGEGAGEGAGAGDLPSGDDDGAGNGLAALGGEDAEAAADAAVWEEVCRAERVALEDERRARAALDAAVAVRLRVGESSRAALVADSLRLFNEKEGAGAGVGAAGAGADAVDEDEDDAARFASERRALKYSEWGATAAAFFDRTALGAAAGSVGASADVAPAAPPPPPAASRPPAAPALLLTSATPAPASSAADEPSWFASLDTALVKLTSQAAFDFDKVARGLQAAGACMMSCARSRLSGRVTYRPLPPPQSHAASYGSPRCRRGQARTALRA